MTYEEDYQKCKTLQELRKKVQSDISTAIVIGNTDRLKIIKSCLKQDFFFFN